jgi:DNA-binding CsgD family transcriptional regulator
MPGIDETTRVVQTGLVADSRSPSVLDESTSHVIDTIYSAALDPDLWPAALGAVVGFLDASSAGFGTCTLTDGRLELLPIGFDERAAIDYTRYYARVDQMLPAILAAPRGSAYSDRMLVPRREMERSEIYNDWAAPNGIRSAAALVLQQDSERIIMLAMSRERRDCPFESPDLRRLESIAEHLRRALRIQERLDGAAGRASALDRLTLGVLSVAADGRIHYANPSAEEILTEGSALRVQAGVLSATRPVESRSLQKLLHDGAGTMSLPRRQRPPLIVVVMPATAGCLLPGETRSARFVFISDPATRTLPLLDHLQGLFGLTPMQARLAREIACGDGIDAAAARLGMARGTARTHLAAVFAKTHTRRQAELVRLLDTCLPQLRGG